MADPFIGVPFAFSVSAPFVSRKEAVIVQGRGGPQAVLCFTQRMKQLGQVFQRRNSIKR